MRQGLSVALAFMLGLLAACQGTPPVASTPRKAVPAATAALLTLEGELRVPANVVGGALIGQDGSSLVGQDGSSLVAAGGGNYRLRALSERALAGAAVFVSDLQGKRIASVPAVATDAAGHFRLVGLAGDTTYQLVAQVKTARGTGTLMTLVHTGSGNAAVDISAATTLAARALMRVDTPALARMDPGHFTAVVAAMAAHMETEAMPDWADAEAVQGMAARLASEEPAVAAAVPSPTASGSAAPASAAPVASAAPTTSPVTTPASPTPSVAPSAVASTGASASPTPSPTVTATSDPSPSPVAAPPAEAAVPTAAPPPDRSNPANDFTTTASNPAHWSYWGLLNGVLSPMTYGTDGYGTTSWFGTNGHTTSSIYLDGTGAIVLNADEYDGGVALGWEAQLNGVVTITGNVSVRPENISGMHIGLTVEDAEQYGEDLTPGHQSTELNQSFPVRRTQHVYLQVVPLSPDLYNFTYWRIVLSFQP